MADRQWLQEVQRASIKTINPQNKGHSFRPIYRLPESLKSYSKCSYDPQIVKLGLFHQDKENLPFSQIEEKKFEAVCETVKRLSEKGKTMEDLVGEIRKLDIRQFYDQEPEMKCHEDELARRFTMDGCFILEFFKSTNFELYFRRWDIFLDIFKLENQIPLVVLVKILELEYATHEEAVLRLARMLFKYPPFQDVPFCLTSVLDDVKEEIDRADHLLDLLHRMVVRFLTQSRNRMYMQAYGATLPEDLDEDLESDCEYHLLSAENLQKDGIKLLPSREGKVKFQKGFLEQSILFLPEIYVDGDTEGVIRNLMAFDCDKRTEKREERAIICQLMILMNCLIETRKDVSILRKKRILGSRKGSDKELAVIFNNLCKGIPDVFPYYKEEVRKLEEHCNKKLKGDSWISWYKKYLSKPWKVLYVVVVAITLALTAVQAYYSAKG